MSVSWGGSELDGISFMLSCAHVATFGGRMVTVSDRPDFWQDIADRHSTPCTTVECYTPQEYKKAVKTPFVLIEKNQTFKGYGLEAS